jgi:D-lactate dehydrogenase (cytochrome)
MIIKKEKDEILNYLHDAANYKGDCNAVYIPESIDELIETVIYCNNNKIKITVSGNRTGLTGGAIPTEGIILSVEKFNKIIEINDLDNYIITQPAVLLSNLKEEVQKKGLFYTADPTEQNCFIGSTVATNASGARTYKFGATRNFVEELKIITPTGDKLTIKRGNIFVKDGKTELITDNGNKFCLKIPDINLPLTKNSAGYYCKEGMDVIDLFIGSEGTLGIIYEIKLRLLKLPDKFFSAVLFFNDLNSCFDIINHLKESKEEIIKPSALEFMDKNSLLMIKSDYPNIPYDSNACLWLEQDINSDKYEELIDKYIDIFEEFGVDTSTVWFAFSDTELKEFQQFRHAIPSKVNEYISKNNFTKVGTDIAVPDDIFKMYYHECIDIVTKSGLNYVAYGHFGNSHIHLNMLPKNETELAKAKEIYAELCTTAVNVKGTISAEHGIGKLKAKYLKLMYEDVIIKSFASIKKTLDPNLVLNMGNIIEEQHYYEI